MTTTGFSQRSVAALAALVHEIRPDWNEAGTAAEIRRHAHVPLAAAAVALIRAATDAANETPAALSQANNRAWHDFEPWRCKTHPEQRARRTNGECASCWADAHEGQSPPRFNRRPRPASAVRPPRRARAEPQPEVAVDA